MAATLEDRWILSRFNRVANEINEALADYRFHEAAHVVYHFFWGEFCDWYIELIKPRLAELSDREASKARFRTSSRCSRGRCDCSRRSCRSSPKKSGTRFTMASRR